MTLKEYFQSIKNDKIAVVGFGISNRPLVNMLIENGCSAVTICDQRQAASLGEEYARLKALGVRFRLGEDYLAQSDYDIVFRTPGLHPRFLQGAIDHGAQITSEMELFFRFCPCRTIAVTGSDGKTTTSTLIARLLQAAGHSVFLGGNIGTPLLNQIGDMTPQDIAVLELSSFQLHSMDCSPNIAVVTNISPNHLDIHPSYEDYIDAKKNVFRHQSAADTLVLNLDNSITASFAREAAGKVRWFSSKLKPEDGCWLDAGGIYRRGRRVIDVSEVKLPGAHNLENLMAAFAATDGLVSDEEAAAVARSFAGVPHRLEHIRRLRGVDFYNDSIASSPTRTVAGLRSFDKKVILIAGGHDKNVPFDVLAAEIPARVKALVLTGETAQKIRHAVERVSGCEKPPIYMEDSFQRAIQKAGELATAGDAVLLSPACSSFDQFKNFEERGNCFRKIVEEME